MALPTVTKSWQFAVNQSFSDGTLATTRTMIRAIKNQLIGAGGLTWTDSTGTTTTPTGNWTVIGSSNGVTAGIDAVDRWAADGDLLFNTAGSAHSWIILQQTGISATFQMLIALDNTSFYNATISVSHTAYSGGSATANPTSANAVTLASGANWGPSSSAATTRVHVMRTTDGSCNRIIFHRNGWVAGMLLVDALGNVQTGLAQSYIALGLGTSTAAPGSNTPTATVLSTTAAWNGFYTTPLVAFAGSLSSGNGPACMLLGGASAFNSDAGIFGIFMNCQTAGQRGPMGALVDGWFGLSQNSNVTTHPDTGTLKQFCQHGLFVTPWNRSTPASS